MASEKDQKTRRPKGPPLDPTEFLEQLKEEHRLLQWEPLPPPPPNQTIGGEQDRNRASLEYLHHHWQLPHTYGPEGAGGGVKGKAIALFGRLTFRVLGHYLREERDLLSHMVQVNEALERRCDQLTLLMLQINTEVLNRQVAEAKNQAVLAVWLHSRLDPDAADVPAGGTADEVPGDGAVSPGATASTR